MDRWLRLVLAAAAAATAALVCATAAPATVYWLHDATSPPATNPSLPSAVLLGFMANDGAGLVGFTPATASPDTLDLAVGDHVYLSSAGPEEMGIWRAATAVDPDSLIVDTAPCPPLGVAVDEEHVYWASPDCGTIGRAPLAGGPAEHAFIAGLSAPRWLAVSASHLFWSDADGAIGRAAIDGSDVRPAFISASAERLATDGRHVYWADPDGGRIGRAAVDGGDVRPSLVDIAGVGVHGVAIADGALWWTEWPSLIAQAPLWDLDARRVITLPFAFPFTGGVGLPTSLVVTGPRPELDLGDDGAFGATNAGTSVTRTLTIGNGRGPVVEPLTIAADGVTLAGADADDFTVTADGCSGTTVAPGGSCEIAVRFAPGWVGDKVARLELAANSSVAPLVVPLTGRGTQPSFAASPGTVDLGAVRVGETGPPQAVTIANQPWAMGGPMTIPGGGVTVAGPDAGEVAIVDDGCAGRTLAPGEDCQVEVALAPTARGVKTAALRVDSDAPGGPHQVQLGGIARAPEAAVAPVSLDFGPVRRGHASAPRTVTVANAAVGPTADALVLGADAVSLGGPSADRYAIVADGCSGTTLAPGDACSVELRFEPSVLGPQSATLTVSGDAPGGPQQVTLAGAGVQPLLAVTPAALDLGAIDVGQASPPQALAVINDATGPGAGPLSFGGGAVTVAGADAASFQLTDDGCSGAVLAPGDSCAVEVRFSPASQGAKAANLRLVSDAPGSPHLVPLAGVGIAAPGPPAGGGEGGGPVAPPGGGGATGPGGGGATGPEGGGDAGPNDGVPRGASPAPADRPGPSSPAATLAVELIDARLPVGARGVARARLRCAGPAGAWCVVAVQLRRSRGDRLGLGASTEHRLPAGATRRVAVALRRAVARRLAGPRCRKRPARLWLALDGPSGTEVSSAPVALWGAGCRVSGGAGRVTGSPAANVGVADR